VYAYCLVNRLPLSLIRGKIPIEDWSGRVAQDYNSFRVFGCPAYYRIKEDKMHPRARKCVFVGFK